MHHFLALAWLGIQSRLAKPARLLPQSGLNPQRSKVSTGSGCFNITLNSLRQIEKTRRSSFKAAPGYLIKSPYLHIIGNQLLGLKIGIYNPVVQRLHGAGVARVL